MLNAMPAAITHISLIFDPALYYFLRPENRTFERKLLLTRKASIKDIIESQGVPHTEIGRIVANGQAVDFSFIPRQEQKIELSAIHPPFDVFHPSLLRPHPLAEWRFIVDVNVAKLASLLRMLGFDTAYSRHFSDCSIARLAALEQRIVLSRDIELFKRKQITFGRWIRNTDPDAQLVEVLHFFGIKGPFVPFSRCLKCNRPLEPVPKKEIEYRLEPKTRRYFHHFKICRQCHQIFWRGSHFDEMCHRLENAGITIEAGLKNQDDQKKRG